MSSPNNPRKRPAPGSSSMKPVPPIQQTFAPVQPDRLFHWNGNMDGTGFTDAGTPPVNQYTMMPTTGAFSPAIAAPSTALARRQNSRALVHTGNRNAFDQNGDAWNGFGEDTGYLQPSATGVDEHDNIERLEEMAQRAKREATQKRKQIPPFVQKLSSFLDESRNTDLIRWSDKGDSFVVLDEDEFAKTLIPELFKHNNYASFVRQLNMYGFHKRVGLSDNSMKASERKNKSPSEYYNPYFRRGHPNLLWLINKPKSGNSKKKGKKDDGDAESEEDGNVEETYIGPSLATPQPGRAVLSHDVGVIPRKDFVHFKSELSRLQQQQVAISSMINKLRQDQSELYKKAITFQDQHDRHESSINAILTFLANVFRKSLEEQGGVQTVQDLLASIIPSIPTNQGHGQPQMPPQGGIVDFGFVNPRPQNITAIGTPKRQQRLLPPVPHLQAGKQPAISPSPTPSPAPQTSYHLPQMGTVTELFDTSPGDTTSPSYMKNELQANPQEGMMKIIQDTNAVNVNPNNIGLSDVAAKTPASMSTDQRNQMLSIMARSNASAPANGVPPTPSPAPTMPAQTPAPAPTTGLSLSPILASVPIPPSLQAFQTSQVELDAVNASLAQQQADLDRIASMLGPLSPSGRIPGVDSSGNVTGFYDNVDFDKYLNTNAYSDPGFGNAFGSTGMDNSATDVNDLFTLDNADYNMGAAGMSGAGANNVDTSIDSLFEPGRVFETNSANNSPSPANTEEIPRSDVLGSPEREAKRRRKG
ncbi:putative heat shock factor protein [Podospora australis]|uniref:Heat shock factor protein n=1 Tax=Podospora australis TaxID=1536484 RepID=A0AAN6WXY3_9PEZI|nr:putative heat shock factor protein [Podospora australis]